MRRLHMWISMVSLLIVLFFALTGITLNHPSWTFGQSPVVTTTTGHLPQQAVSGGELDFLVASEYLRDQQHVSGEVTDHSTQDGAATISYRGPGYAADVSIRIADRAFTLNVEQGGLVARLNDLHKGRNASPLWKAVIDVTAAVLVAMSLTGIVLQLTIRRTRRLALGLIAAGVAAGLALIAVSG